MTRILVRKSKFGYTEGRLCGKAEARVGVMYHKPGVAWDYQKLQETRIFVPRYFSLTKA